MIPELFINRNSEFTFVSFSSSHSLWVNETAHWGKFISEKNYEKNCEKNL